MAGVDLARRLAAEFLGTCMLVATVVGSGIMAESLADGNAAIALLANAMATGAILVVLIAILGPLSGAHLNPIVSLVFVMRRELEVTALLPYIAAQFAGGILGTFLAHAMFDLPIIQVSNHVRDGAGQFRSEIVAAFGLILTILGCLRFRPNMVPASVALFVAAGYWFTASTCFANPAVAIARSLTDTFAGIRPSDLGWFIVAEVLGAMIAAGVGRWLFPALPAARADTPKVKETDLVGA